MRDILPRSLSCAVLLWPGAAFDHQPWPANTAQEARQGAFQTAVTGVLDNIKGSDCQVNPATRWPPAPAMAEDRVYHIYIRL